MRRAVAEADAVVAGEVRRRLRGRDEVVARQPEVDGAREGALPHLGAELAAELDRALDRLANAGLDRLVVVQLARDADAQPGQAVPFRKDDPRHVDRGRVARVAPRDHRVQVRAVADVLRHRADLVEARRERDDPVTGDGSVRRPQTDVPAQRRRLLDRPAGVGPERPRCKARRHRRRRAPARPARDARRIPRVVRRAVRGVLGGRAHRELVRVRLAEDAEPVLLAARDHRRVVHRHVALQDLRAGGRRDPLRADHVLDRDRDALPARVLAHVQVAVELGVALADRLEVRGEELGARDFLPLEQLLRPFGRQPEGVDHEAPPGGTRK